LSIESLNSAGGRETSIQPDLVDNPKAKSPSGDLFGPLRRAIRLREGLVARLHDKEAAAIFVRLIQSKHVADLQLIAFITYRCAVFVFPIATVVFVGWHLLFSKDYGFYINNLWKWWFVPVVLGNLLAVAIPIIGSFLSFAAVILAWCYQSGNARLGIVDLFACEITTLCRVCTIVKLTQNCIDSFDEPNAGVRERFSRFDSSEGYTPVFDGNAKDLQVLDVGVVTNITAFYTYWNAMRDAFRHLASTAAGKPSEIDSVEWRNAMCNVIYMQFLAFESARKAVNDLVEFEPSHAENTITILLSELPAFKFLLDRFKGEDVRRKRLALRRDEYPEIVEKVRSNTETNARSYPIRSKRGSLSSHNKALAAGWDKAGEMLDSLRACYQSAFPDSEIRAPEGAAPPIASGSLNTKTR